MAFRHNHLDNLLSRSFDNGDMQSKLWVREGKGYALRKRSSSSKGCTLYHNLKACTARVYATFKLILHNKKIGWTKKENIRHKFIAKK